MNKQEFFYLSKDNKTKIRAIRYIPDKEVIGIVQIAHGMCEYIDRYDDFAKFLCDKGYLVTGNDHLGHGESVINKNEWGYFAPNNGDRVVLEDMYELTKITKQIFPKKQYFLLGHSMGSFFTRQYIAEYGNELSGVIIMGTGLKDAKALKSGISICKLIKTFRGDHYRSNIINNIVMGTYNKKWEPSKTHCDWLSRDEENIMRYANEPKCQFMFTINGFENLFSIMSKNIEDKYLDAIPKDLPILIVSGQDDPVGDFGKAPTALEQTYKQKGIKDVELKLYENDRHEILNETDRKDVYEYLYQWLKSKTKA